MVASGFLFLLLLAGDGRVGRDPAAEVARLLLSPARQAGEEEVVQALRRLGEPAVPALIICATGDALAVIPPEALGDGRSLAVRPDRFGLAAESALAGMPPAAVVSGLTEHLAKDRTLAARTAAARVLGGLSASEGLDLALLILRNTTPDELRAPYVRQPIRDSLAGPLRVERDALGKVEDDLEGLDTPHLAVVVEALAEGERADADQLLIDVLGTDPGLTIPVLEALGKAVGKRPFESQTDLEGTVARLLQDEDPDRRAVAARTAGEAGLTGIAWALIERLADDSVEVRSAARAALRTLAAADHGFDAGAWSFLVERERRFVETGGLETLLGEVASDDLATAGSALRRLAEHPLLRRDFGTRIGDALCKLPPETARGAAGALANLRARNAIPGLVDLVGCAKDEETRQAAAAALAALTGADPAPEPAAWKAWLARR